MTFQIKFSPQVEDLQKFGTLLKDIWRTFTVVGFQLYEYFTFGSTFCNLWANNKCERSIKSKDFCICNFSPAKNFWLSFIEKETELSIQKTSEFEYGVESMLD